jgi:hypothetical protein
MPIETQKWIKRQDLRNNRDKLYIFGDNLSRVGYGGQAKEMRGEPNAVGIPTKAHPGLYLSDAADLPRLAICLRQHFADLIAALYQGKTIVLPADGIGTGLADLQNQAPACWYLLQAHLIALYAVAKACDENNN